MSSIFTRPDYLGDNENYLNFVYMTDAVMSGDDDWLDFSNNRDVHNQVVRSASRLLRRNWRNSPMYNRMLVRREARRQAVIREHNRCIGRMNVSQIRQIGDNRLPWHLVEDFL